MQHARQNAQESALAICPVKVLTTTQHWYLRADGTFAFYNYFRKRSLMRAERFEARMTSLRIAARALAILARRNSALVEELPRLTWLPDTERQECVRELLSNLIAGADTGELLPFGRSLTSWRSTAVIWSDPRLAGELQGPFAGDGPEVTRPKDDS
ncbi:hypothetical protein ACIBO5_02205 [Nonomuraea angiospora]|uniref:hypothetical protein n=1 Tax=Nonomuraea angiospora TaxID=46172 RepID=UPI00378B77B2